MSKLNQLLFALTLSLGLMSGQAAICAAVAEQNAVKYPALLSAGNRNVSSGRAVMPFLVSLAQRPELLQPPYLRLVLGTPDKAKAFPYPADTFSWTPTDGTSSFFILSRHTDSRPPVGGEIRQLSVSFKHSGISLCSVRSRLGKPVRKYFDNRSNMVELYQLSPNSTLSVTEAPNSFDVSQMTVTYNGPYLPQASKQDMAYAASHRLRQIDHHLSKGNRDRGLALLQEHVGDNPQDMQAHLVLAEALRNRCDVNNAIGEFRKVLSLAQACGDQEMQKKALQGLAPLGLVPPGTGMVKPMTLLEAARGGNLTQ